MARQPNANLEQILGDASGMPTPETESESETQQGQPTPENRSYPSREEKTPVQAFLNKDAHTQLRIAGFQRNMSNQDILIEALNAWFKINNLPPIA